MAGLDTNKLSVVFMSPHWQCDGYGIATVTRSLINDLHKTDPEGQGLQLTCMIVEEESKIKQKDTNDAGKLNVTLIGAQLPFGARGKVVPDLTWINLHTRSYYWHVPEKQNIDFIIGHVPYLADGPSNIKELCSRQGILPKVGLVIHSFPQNKDGDIDEDLLVEWLRNADFVFSVGKGIQFEIETYLDYLDEDARPQHELYIPGCSVDLLKLARRQKEEPVKGPQTITMITNERKEISVRGLDFKLGIAATAKATQKVLDQSSLGNQVSVNLTTVGADPEESMEWKEVFEETMDNVSKEDKRLRFTHKTMRDQEELKNILRRSDLCILPLHKESNLFGVEALMAGYAGVPILVARNAGIADILFSMYAKDSMIETKGAFLKDVNKWADRITLKILNAKDSNSEARAIKDYLISDTSIESTHHKFTATVLGKFCALLHFLFGEESEVTGTCNELAKQLGIGIDLDDDCNVVEVYTTAFTQYFLHQHSKINHGLLDAKISSAVKETWKNFITLLEHRGRRVLEIRKGSMLVNIYCPTKDSVEDLRNETEAKSIKKALITFLTELGICPNVVQSRVMQEPEFSLVVRPKQYNLKPQTLGKLRQSFEEESSGIGTSLPDTATILPYDKTMEWLVHNIPDAPKETRGGMTIIQSQQREYIIMQHLGKNEYVRKFCFLPSGDIVSTHNKQISTKQWEFCVSHMVKDGSSEFMSRRIVSPKGPTVRWDVAFVNIDEKLNIVLSTSVQLVLWDLENLKSRVVYEKMGSSTGSSILPFYKKPTPKGHYLYHTQCFSVVDENTVACTRVLPVDGFHEIDVLDIRPGEWFPIRTIRAELGHVRLYDMCYTQSVDGPQLILCSHREKMVVAVGFNDGKIKWRITPNETGIKMHAYSVCADQLGRVFVACAPENSIYILSAEDGAVIGCLNLNPPIVFPFCIRTHQNKLWVAHMEEKAWDNGEWKWLISHYDVE